MILTVARLCCINGAAKPGRQHTCTGLTEYLQPTTETYCSERKTPFKILLLADKVPGPWSCNVETSGIFLPAKVCLLCSPRVEQKWQLLSLII